MKRTTSRISVFVTKFGNCLFLVFIFFLLVAYVCVCKLVAHYSRLSEERERKREECVCVIAEEAYILSEALGRGRRVLTPALETHTHTLAQSISTISSLYSIYFCVTR